jgi:hypothetical protein
LNRETARRAFRRAREDVSRAAVERALADLIAKLQGWKSEIRAHHREIAKRNFAIGLEVHGFTTQFNPRQFRGMDMVGRIAKALNIHHNSLRQIMAISAWLYGDRGVRSITRYMKAHQLKTWNQIVQHYLDTADSAKALAARLNMRQAGIRRSLEVLSGELPKSYRGRVDDLVRELTSIIREVTGEPVSEETTK